MEKFSRKEFGRLLFSTALPLAFGARCSQSQPPSAATSPTVSADLLLRNGRIVDGTGAPWYRADVAIQGGRISDIGRIPESAAREVIDISDLTVCPGLIDPHAHEEILQLGNPNLEKFVRQGVTTIINGNCGHSVTPYGSKRVLEYWWREGLIDKSWIDREDLQWEGVDGYAKLVDDLGGTTINSAILLGYGGIRWGAMDGAFDRPPNPDEWQEIERLVAEGVDQGAVGMSTGLSYIPARYASTEELIRVARVLASKDAIYASHTRFGKEGDPTGGLEAIEIGEKGGCRVQISHFRNTQAAFEMVTDAHDRGLQVAADVIPSSLSHRRRSDRMLEALMVFYPGAFDYTLDQLKNLLRDEKSRAEILDRVSFFNNNKSQVVIVRAETDKHRANVGKSVTKLAQELNREPGDLYLEMVLDEQNPVVFTFDGDVRERRQRGARPDRSGQQPVAEGYWTRHRLFGPGSDSIPIDKGDPYGWYEQQRRGAFPAYLKLAKQNEVPLGEALMKATSLPARQFQLLDRGLISPGKVADLMVFDPAGYSFPTPSEADPNDPFAMATGVHHVVVNGEVILRDRKLTQNRPGKVLLKS